MEAKTDPARKGADEVESDKRLATRRGLSKHKLDLVGVQEVRWEGGGPESEGQYTFFYRKGNENRELGTGFCA
jgi:hypothetical protein